MEALSKAICFLEIFFLLLNVLYFKEKLRLLFDISFLDEVVFLLVLDINQFDLQRGFISNDVVIFLRV